MASGGKKKTTMAKLAREHKLRERRMEKMARKAARGLIAPDDAEQAAARDNAERQGTMVPSELPDEVEQPLPAA